MPGMRVGGSAMSLEAKHKHQVNLQLIFVGIGWLVALVLCIVILTSRAETTIKTIVGIALTILTLASICFVACSCMGSSQPTSSKLKELTVVNVDPLQPCALCGLYLGELCKMHGPGDANGMKASDVCPCTRGKCGHTYHFHCLAVYLDQCATSRRKAMCPDVTDPFLWEFALREDKRRYGQWMASRPMKRRSERKKSPTKFRMAASDPSVTWPAPQPRIVRRESARMARTPSGRRANKVSPMAKPPGRAVPVPVGRSESSRRLRVASARGGAGSLRRVSREDHNSRMLGLRQLPLEVHRMQENLVRAREDMAKAKAVLERETHSQHAEKLRSREAVRTAQAAWQRQTQTVEELKGKLEEMKDEKLCAVCLENEKDTAFQCGHQTCQVCAPELSECPFCRATISTRIKLYS